MRRASPSSRWRPWGTKITHGPSKNPGRLHPVLRLLHHTLCPGAAALQGALRSPGGGSGTGGGRLPGSGAHRDHLSLYGRELELCLPDAVEAAASVPGIDRVRIGSLEPELLTDADIARLAAVPQLCGQFHLSLQSGCDATLARIDRHYTTARYREIAGALREKFPGVRHHHRCDHRLPRGDSRRVR